MNVVVLQGRLSSEPKEKALESGTLLLRYEVTVARDGEPADSVPVAWFGPPGERPAPCEQGEEVVVLGRVRRRWWQAPSGRASSTEVQAEAVLAAGDRRRVTAAVRRARTALG